MEENTIHHAEDRGGAGNAQDQGDQRDDCEPRILPKHSQTIAKVLEQVTHSVAFINGGADVLLKHPARTRQANAGRVDSSRFLAICRAVNLRYRRGIWHRVER